MDYVHFIFFTKRIFLKEDQGFLGKIGDPRGSKVTASTSLANNSSNGFEVFFTEEGWLNFLYQFIEGEKPLQDLRGLFPTDLFSDLLIHGPKKNSAKLA
ncbi:MAG: hypothetical protein U1F66_04895 [bacterium]